MRARTPDRRAVAEDAAGAGQSSLLGLIKDRYDLRNFTQSIRSDHLHIEMHCTFWKLFEDLS